MALLEGFADQIPRGPGYRSLADGEEFHFWPHREQDCCLARVPESQLGLKRKTKVVMDFLGCVTGSPVVKSADAKRMGKMAAFDLRLH